MAFKLEKYSKDILLTKYPLGYVIFSVGENKQIIIPDNNPIKDKYNIDWTNVKLIADNNFIHIEIPEIEYKGVKIFYAKVNADRDKGLGDYHLQIMDLAIFLEILADDSDGLICLLGFKEIYVKIIK